MVINHGCKCTLHQLQIKKKGWQPEPLQPGTMIDFTFYAIFSLYIPKYFESNSKYGFKMILLFQFFNLITMTDVFSEVIYAFMFNGKCLWNVQIIS